MWKYFLGFICAASFKFVSFYATLSMCPIFLMVSDGCDDLQFICVSRAVLFSSLARERGGGFVWGTAVSCVFSSSSEKTQIGHQINIVGAGRTEQSRAQFSQLNARWLLFEMVAILLCEMWRMNWKRMVCPDGSRPATILILSIPTSTRTGCLRPSLNHQGTLQVSLPPAGSPGHSVEGCTH